jgi:uncharacterized protein
MKKLIFAVILMMSATILFAQDITGQWNGLLDVRGTQLRIVFNITKSGEVYSSTMDSPDQKAFGIPVATTSFKNQVLKLEMPNLGVTYEGKLDETNAIAGTFQQSGMSFALKLTRNVPEKPKVVRPQEPVKPYPYYCEDVVFENKKDEIELAGTLTLPSQTGIFPAVILITGSGPQNRDEELMGHKPFLLWSDYLTRNGIAVLRFDDRGTAGSKGNFGTATSVEFASDVEAALQYLMSRKEIDKKKIGLMGHSEGGIIAPMVAAESKDVSFIVLLAGTGITGGQILLMQQELIGKASGVSDAELQKNKRINQGAFDLVMKSTNSETIKAELKEYIKESQIADSTSKIPAGMTKDQYVDLQVKQVTSPWMLYFIKHDPSITLQKVKCPVLAINGSKDQQVPPKENLAAIKEALAKAGNKDVTTKELPGLNHLFQECTTGSPDEYSTIDQTISPAALSEVTTWILKHTQKK